MPRAGDASTRDRRLALFGDRDREARALVSDEDEGLDTEPSPGRSPSPGAIASRVSSEALAAAAAASARNRPVDMGVKGKARAVFEVAFRVPSAFPGGAFSRAGSKKGTGPVSQEPSGVLLSLIHI